MGTPSIFDILGARIRAVRSVAPPAPGKIRVIVLWPLFFFGGLLAAGARQSARRSGEKTKIPTPSSREWQTGYCSRQSRLNPHCDPPHSRRIGHYIRQGFSTKHNETPRWSECTRRNKDFSTIPAILRSLCKESLIGRLYERQCLCQTICLYPYGRFFYLPHQIERKKPIYGSFLRYLHTLLAGSNTHQG